ncbi:hypothetical protein HanXRQr2_Chr11g0475541 [Helianthus annuus]|uniref:DUF4283 domain-containing protein n=1 Tax=Helianthus annuus TaxID=4232 RepID=A0A9K3HMA1_HELAN|nr:hypothetical protein HanXRQr2_Chr11g0475541 [Helianthus annuus]KAJ0508002.1 hypothetical protein HanIR_Chr11g0512511 [Helianthus annuus]KAJ0516344.1 hypothetical protein HanHA89_Chr11g0412851 [Helianthus annuus]
MKGIGGSNRDGQFAKQEKSLVVLEDVCAFKELAGKAVVGVSVSLDVLVSLRRMLANARIYFSSIHYIGELSVMINFNDHKVACEFACNHDLWKEWFGQLDVWQVQSLPYDRIAWLKVFGVPINLAEEEVFRRIGQEFGKVLHVAGLGSEDEDLSVNRIGVLVGEGKSISDEINLLWQDKCFIVWNFEDMDD